MQHVLPSHATQPARIASLQPQPTRGLLQRLAVWAELRRQRRALLAMSDAMLHDIGISRADAEGEAMRPFWDVPQGWH